MNYAALFWALRVKQITEITAKVPILRMVFNKRQSNNIFSKINYK